VNIFSYSPYDMDITRGGSLACATSRIHEINIFDVSGSSHAYMGVFKLTPEKY
jgi:hypothetical protein